MNSIALALVLFAAVLHASWNFVSKKSGGGSSFVLLYETFAFLVYMPLLYLVDFKRLLTLPVELNASKRALNTISQNGFLIGAEKKKKKKVLTAAALTYVAALASSLATLLRLILISERRR